MASKYGNKVFKDEDGITWHSKGEHKRWLELRFLNRNGVISNLERQVPYILEVNGVFIGKYIADFRYLRAGASIVEDFKGVLTDTFKLKRNLMKAIHNIEILITKGKNSGQHFIFNGVQARTRKKSSSNSSARK